MKKAFTLIELLVVIAIIAILAAILFPVFAQAKLAAKKAVSISNQKQIGLGIIMYSGDADDLYPREDGCTLNDSMNPAYDNLAVGTDPTPYCNGTGGAGGAGAYAFRDNHYSWQKWAMPYIKTRDLYTHPVIQHDTTAWFQGELFGGYGLNLAITGALNTWPTVSKYGGIRNSFTGGTQTSIPAPADAMLIMEQFGYPAIGALEWPTNTSTTTYYPLAIREHWQSVFYTQGGAGPCKETTTVDPVAAPFAGQVPVSYADGHTKTISVGNFLALTPSAAQYGVGFNAAYCQNGMAYYFESNVPTWTQPWPFWGLQ